MKSGILSASKLLLVVLLISSPSFAQSVDRIAHSEYPKLNDEDAKYIIQELRAIPQRWPSIMGGERIRYLSVREKMRDLQQLWYKALRFEGSTQIGANNRWLNLILKAALLTEATPEDRIVVQVLLEFSGINSSNIKNILDHSLVIQLGSSAWDQAYTYATSIRLGSLIINRLKDEQNLSISLAPSEVGRLIQLVAACHRYQ